MWFQQISQTLHTNLLIVGDESATQSAMARMLPWLTPPVHACVLPGPLLLPQPGAGTLVLQNVGALDCEQQRQLLHWLEEKNGAPRVVLSTTPLGLYAEVERGTFSDRLYYRLSVLLEEADG